MILRERLIGLEKDIVDKNHRRYLTSVAKLDAMSPLKVMTRGYAIVHKENQEIVRSVRDVKTGDRLTARVSDGEIVVAVERAEGVNYESKQ